MNESSDAERDRPGESPSRTRTWPTGLPALRLYRRQQVLVPPPELKGDASAATSARPMPRLLRTKRALIGLALLALAWLGLLIVAMLGMAAWHVLPIQRLSFALVVALVEIVGACWIGMAALGCLLVGAFCVMLALTRQEW